MFNLSGFVEPAVCTTQKHRLLYTINYGITQPMMKSGILFCTYIKPGPIAKLGHLTVAEALIIIKFF